MPWWAFAKGDALVVVQKQMDALHLSLLSLWNSCQKLLRDFAGMHQQLNFSLWVCPRVQTWGYDIRISQNGYLDRDNDFVPFSNQTWLARKSPEPSDFFGEHGMSRRM